MKIKKITAILMTAIFIISSAGCGKNTDNNSGGNQKSSESGKSDTMTEGSYVSEAEGGKTTDQFTIMAGWTSESPDDTMVQKAMREQMGIDYKVEFMQSNDYLTTLNLKLSSNSDLSDVIIIPYDITAKNALVNADRVLKLNDIYTSDKLDNIPNIDSRIKDYITEKNGDMWWIPGYYASDYDDPWPGWTVDSWWVRKDLLEKAGATEEDLKTIEGLEKTMKSFAGLKDQNGNSIIPLSFAQGENHEERIIVSTFGVDMASGTSGMPAVMKEGDNFVFSYDNPNYKNAYQWMNKMYREGLIDMEACTMSKERFQEKVESGQIAMFTTDLWISGLNETWKNYDSAADSVTFNYEPVGDPQVSGVEKGYTSYVNPNPGYMVFINKDTKHLNAVLHFLDWCNDPSPYRDQEISDGPEGIYWKFIDKNAGTWDFTGDYKVERDSGDSARMAACSANLWQLGSSSNKWYAWWNQFQEGNKAGAELTSKWCKYISSDIVNHRTIDNADNVKADADSIISENLSVLNSIVDEYTAKMIMASSEEEFESVYNEFKNQLDKVAHWSDMKNEWLSLYKEQYGNNSK